MDRLDYDKIKDATFNTKKYIKNPPPLTDEEFNKMKSHHSNDDLSIDDLKFENSNFKGSTYLKK